MRLHKITILVPITILLISGCSLTSGAKKQEKIAEIESQVQQINNKLPSMEPMVLRVIGYGAIDPKAKDLSPVQRKLMALRASKLDAYRTLAERVYGTSITGNSTVENLVAKDDRFRAYVDTYILGARVVSQDKMEDGSYETILEMIIDEGFRNCLTIQSNGRRNAQCASEMIHDLESYKRNGLSRQSVNDLDTGLYFIE
ncbi:LPP20 family lipoprotein [Gynuella sp.]|uniref:LPP20 family lipoprotein n=1 Tax=Gynuella sp. TaxID=2969146 RepID=UPI003D137F87